jgi:hypothetical protein
MSDDELTLRISLEDDGGSSDPETAPNPNPSSFDIPRFYQRYPEKVPANKPEIARALSGQQFGPPTPPTAYTILQEKYGPPAPSALNPQTPVAPHLNLGTPMGPMPLPQQPQQQMMLPLSSEMPRPQYGPPPPPEKPTPSDFVLQYGDAFKNLTEVLSFHQKYGRVPTPGDQPDMPKDGSKPVLRVDASDAQFYGKGSSKTPWSYPDGTLPDLKIDQRMQGPPSNPPFQFNYSNSPPGLPPGFNVPPGFTPPGGGGQGGGGAGGGGRGGTGAPGGGGAGGGGMGGPNNYTVPPPQQTVSQRFWQVMGEDADRYQISSASYTVGGAVGRLTGSAGLGVMSGGLARGAMGVAQGVGMLTTGHVLAIQGIATAATAVVSSFQAISDAGKRLAEQLAPYNGKIAGTLAMQDALNIQRDIKIGNDNQNELSDFAKAQGTFYREFHEFKTEFISSLLPAISFFYRSASVPLRVFNKLDNFLEMSGSSIFGLIWMAAENTIPGLGSAMWALRMAAMLMERWLNDDDDLNKQIDDFLDPTKVDPGAWHPFPKMPPAPRGVF